MADEFGYGRQGPQTAASRAGLLRFFVDQSLGQIATMRLVQVKAVTLGEGSPPAVATVDVQVLVNQVDGNNNAEEHGTIFGIPVLRLGGGANAVVVDPVVGDRGILVVSDRDISNVKETGGVANPGSARQFDLADGVYIGAVLSDAPEQFVWFKPDGGIKLQDSAGNVIETGPSGITITVGAGNLEITGNVIINGVPFGTHRHGGVTIGAGISTGPIP